MRKLKVKLPKTLEKSRIDKEEFNVFEGQPYLSYSQYSKFIKDYKGYVHQYFFGDPFLGNAYTEFGTKIGEALEKGDFSGFTDREKKTLELVPRLDEFERQVIWDLEGFVVMGYIDTNDNKNGEVNTVIDYKTGATSKEDEYDSEEYDQVAIYCAAIGQETGVYPEEGMVVLIERNGNAFRGEGLRLGTKVITIPQDVSKKKINQTRLKLRRTAKRISDHYAVFNKLQEVKV